MNESNDNSIDVELQVRLLNLVIGEASDFERDQLQQLMEQRPELAEYLRHLEHVHGLLSEVGDGEWGVENDPAKADDAWQLSPSRRQQLLAVLEGAELPSEFSLPVFKHKRWFGIPRWNVAILAVCASGVLLLLLLLPGVNAARRSVARLGAIRAKESVAMQAGTDGAWKKVPELHAVQPSDSGTAEYFSFQPNSNGGSSPASAPVLGKSPYLQPKPSRTESRFANGAEANRLSELGLATGGGASGLGMGGTALERSSGGGAGMAEPEVYGQEAAGMGGMAGRMGGMGSGGMGGNVTSNAGVDGFGMGAGGRSGGMGDLAFGQGMPYAAADKPAGSSDQESRGANRGRFRGDRGATPVSDFASDDPFGEPLFRHSFEAVEPSEMAESEFTAPFPQFGGFLVVPKEAPVLGFPLSPIDSIDTAQHSRQLRGVNRDSSPSAGDGRVTLGIELSMEKSKNKEDKDALARKQMDGIDEQTAAADPFSTFSLHVSDVSFLLAQEALNQGQLPDPSSIRIEEFVNAFDYHDPIPSASEKVACVVEQAIHPFLINRNLLRVSMRTSAAGRASNTPLRLTLLLDNSGSMERPDRRQIVHRGLQTLTQQLNESDQVTLLSFGNSPRLLAEKVPGNQGEMIQQIVENMPTEGGTNIEAALLAAGEKALEQQLVGAQNRIVMMTDGAVNLGDADPNRLASLVTQLRDAGIAFDAAGISAHGLNDQVLEALTRQGDGRYYLLNSVEAASDSFSSQIAGALRPSARNVKVQVEFNPQRVVNFKLLGFERHRLNSEDFRNDAVDAAEMAAEEAGVAMYHFEVKPDGQGDVGSVSVRFQDLNTGQMVEQRWPILYEPNLPRLDQSNPSLRIATSAALLAAKLRGGPLSETVDLAGLSRVLSTLPERESNQPRVQQLRTMIQQAKGE